MLIGKYGIGGVKALLERTGFYGGPCRRPLKPLPSGAAEELVATLDAVTKEPLAS